MKQEILFRGQLVNSKKWIEGSLILNPENKYPVIGDIYSEYDDGIKVDNWIEKEVKPETVGQFIFKANGHSFWQDCILKRDKSDQLWVIVWNDEINNFSCLTDYEYRMLSNPDQRQFVLSNHSAVNYIWILKNNFFPIGNIFDNAKLLEVAN